MLTWGSIIMFFMGLMTVPFQGWERTSAFMLSAIVFAIWDFQEKFFTQEKKEA